MLAAATISACSGEVEDRAGSADGGSPPTATTARPGDASPTRAPADGAESETGPEAESPPDSSESSNPEPDLPRVRNPVSLPALMSQRIRGSGITVLGVEAETAAYTRLRVSYRVRTEVEDVTVSGVLLRPRGPGPHPAVVLAHGYIDPAYYVTGQGLAREQDWLARAGFVVLHTDYRGHAGSDPASPLSRESRLGYTRDVIAAVRSLRRQAYVDPGRLALLGRSMGGGVVMNALVTQPGLVDAAVLYASVSSRFLDNLRQFTIPNRPDAAQALYDRFGTPQAAPGFYRGLSPRSYFDRISEPVLLFHGTADESCPVPWARATYAAMRRDGVDARLVIYPGEQHSFVPRWQESIETTVRFLRRRMG